MRFVLYKGSIITDERTIRFHKAYERSSSLRELCRYKKGVTQKKKKKKHVKRMYIQHSFHVPLADDQGVGFPVPRAEVLHRRRRRRCHN